MIEPDALLNLQHSVDRHETAIQKDTTDLNNIKRQIGLVTEALDQLDVAKFQGRDHRTEGIMALERYRAIVQQLKAEQLDGR